jgi:hypothetical protein
LKRKRKKVKGRMKSLELAPLEGSPMKGEIGIEVRGSDGALKEVRHIKNLIVDVGKAAMASRLNGAGAEAAYTYIAIGTGTTAAGADDTALGAEITTGGGARGSATCTRVTTTVTNDTAQDLLLYTFTAAFAVTETGLFNLASAGTMLARQVFSAVNVVSGDTLTVTWKVVFS